jgi:hypothetical protein
MANWEEIKEAFESSDKSIRMIGRMFGVSDTAIRKRVKSESWKKYDPELVEKLIQKKAEAVVEVRDVRRVQTTMSPVTVRHMDSEVRTRVAELERQRSIMNEVGGFAIEALRHSHEMEQSKALDDKFGPEYFGKLKLGSDVVEKAKISMVGRDPILDMIDDVENQEEGEEFTYGICVPTKEQERLKEIDSLEDE